MVCSHLAIAQKTKNKGKNTKNNFSQRINDSIERQKDMIDSVVIFETEIIDKIFFEEGVHPSPSFIWYRNNFDDKKVRLLENVFDSLPDEIVVQLVKRNDNPFVFPVKNKKTSDYGWRMRWNRPHRGVDILLNTGDPVYCCFDGVVRIARPLGNYGNLVVVRHYNGLETVYGHLSKIKVEPLQIVKAGDVIGLGGSTGRSTGPHLHFEVRFQYEAFDPEWILDFEKFTLRSNRLYLDKTYFGIQPPSKLSRGYYTFREDKAETQALPKMPDAMISRYHIVSEGETLKSISKKYGVSENTLKKLNGLKSAKLNNKQKIRIQ